MKKEKRKRSYFTLSPRLKPKKVLSPKSIIFSFAVLLTFQLSISRVAISSLELWQRRKVVLSMKVQSDTSGVSDRSPANYNLHEDLSAENKACVKIFRKTIDNILSLVNTSADRGIFRCFIPLILQHLAGTWKHV